MSDGAPSHLPRSAPGLPVRLPSGDHPPGLVYLDDVLEARVPWLFASVRRRWLLPLVYRMVNHRKAAPLLEGWSRCSSGIDVIQSMHRAVRPRVTARGLAHVPRQGGCLVVANHPTGLTDGVALFDPVCDIRQDVAIFVFHDLLRINPHATDALIPVEWRPAHQTVAKSRETYRIAHRAFTSDRLVTIFPSGRMSYWNGRRIAERPWRDSFIQFARRFSLPILPVHIRARNSLLYYGLSQISSTLRDLQSINEIQNKTGHRYHVTFGAPIAPDRLQGPGSLLAGRIQRYVEEVLPGSPDVPLCDWLDRTDCRQRQTYVETGHSKATPAASIAGRP